ncbi:unnamed protein product [Linum tenue]|uniref:Secreted protein n=1 Tax=Linum tenue TaxID=586396 RepID=A0AAV0HCU1_9ROSI|nr:unnamed protein product [Linum tenue]
MMLSTGTLRKKGGLCILWRLQRTVIAALKAGMAGKGDFRCEAVEEGIKNHARIPQNAYPQRQSPLRQACTMNFRIPRGTNFFLHLYFFPGL